MKDALPISSFATLTYFSYTLLKLNIVDKKTFNGSIFTNRLLRYYSQLL